MIDSSRCSTPVLMKLKTHSTSLDLLCKSALSGAVTLTKHTDVHRIVLCRLNKHLYVPRSRCTCCSVCSVNRTCTTTNHCCNTRIKSSFNLLRADPVDMCINTTSCNDKSLCSKCLCSCTNCHAGCYACLCSRVTCFTDTSDETILDTDICLVNSCIVKDKAVCDNEVKIAVSTCCCN